MGEAINAASWIWLAGKHPHQYVCFRRSFELSGRPKEAWVDISADSDFVLYLNGIEAGRGQFSDWPASKTYTRLEVSRLLRRGRNVLAVLGYYRGEEFSDYRTGEAGMIAAVWAGKLRVVTDGSWKAIEHPAFAPGPMPRVTWQMGFTTQFDARLDLPWQMAEFDDTDWLAATVKAGATDGFWKELEERSVLPLVIEAAPPVAVVLQGSFHRHADGASVAETMMKDSLVTERPNAVFDIPAERTGPGYVGPPPMATERLREDDGRPWILHPPAPGANGRFFVVDLGREEAGLLTLRLDAPAGTVLDIAHGEHLADGRVRAFVGGRNFADRYICRKGENGYTLPFRRLGARYVEVHAWNYDRPIDLHYVGLRPANWPLEDDFPQEWMGSFATPDPLANKAYEIGVRTLRLCMHEHYEDCPWREQSLYAYDSRNQALCGYYAFGNYDFAAFSLELLGRGIREDGLLELCAPAKVSVTIPIFSLVWITELAERWLYGGRPKLFSQFDKQIGQVLRTVLNRYDTRTGLYRLPDAPEIWHFYEWTPGLAGPLGKDDVRGQHHAPYNLYLHEALGSWGWMLSMAGQATEARSIARVRTQLGKAIHQAFWDRKAGLYATRLVAGRRVDFHEHVQALALHQGTVPRATVGRLARAIMERRTTPMTLSSLLYLVQAMMERGPAERRFVAGLIDKYWGGMVLAGATSFWETAAGSADFDYAGSLCHGWSALPVLYYQAYVLGVRPIAPAFSQFLISPYPDRFAEASGAVPTPDGPIRIQWRKRDRGLVVEASGPRECKPVLRPLPEAPVARATYNGKAIRPAG